PFSTFLSTGLPLVAFHQSNETVHSVGASPFGLISPSLMPLMASQTPKSRSPRSVRAEPSAMATLKPRAGPVGGGSRCRAPKVPKLRPKLWRSQLGLSGRGQEPKARWVKPRLPVAVGQPDGIPPAPADAPKTKTPPWDSPKMMVLEGRSRLAVSRVLGLKAKFPGYFPL